MGITRLWTHFDHEDRISLVHYVTSFFEKTNRSPRIAIDAYSLNYRSPDRDEKGKIIKNKHKPADFMCKIRALQQACATFVIVFDGRLKPYKTRHKYDFFVSKQVPKSFDKEYSRFRQTDPRAYEEENKFVKEMKEYLTLNKIQWIQAPAEAEAQCARLYTSGKVDVVITDDSDALLYGAETILRCFSRYPDESVNFQAPSNNETTVKQTAEGCKGSVTDIDCESMVEKEDPDQDSSKVEEAGRAELGVLQEIHSGDGRNQSNEPNKVKRSRYDHKNYYVTPVTVRDVNGVPKLTKEQLIFVGVLLGGDYSRGIENIGEARALKLALCGAGQEVAKTDCENEFSTLPNLAKEFAESFVEIQEEIRDGDAVFTYKPKAPSERLQNKKKFEQKLNQLISSHGKEIFERNTVMKRPIQIDDYFAMLFFFPLVNQHFSFDRRSLSFGESKIDDIVSYEPKLPIPRNRIASFSLKFLGTKKFWSCFTFKKKIKEDKFSFITLVLDHIKLEALCKDDPRFELTDGEMVQENDGLEGKESKNDHPHERTAAKKTNTIVKLPCHILQLISPEYMMEIEKQILDVGDSENNNLQASGNSKKSTKKRNAKRQVDPNQPGINRFFSAVTGCSPVSSGFEAEPSNKSIGYVFGDSTQKENHFVPSPTNRVATKSISREALCESDDNNLSMQNSKRRRVDDSSFTCDLEDTTGSDPNLERGDCEENPILISSQ